MKKIIKDLYYLIFTLIIFSIISIYLLFYTSLGLKITFNLATQFIPGELKIEKFQGEISSHVTLRNLSYKNDTLALKVSYAELFWNPWQLLNGKLDIQFINVNNIKIILKQTTHNQDEKSSFSLNWLKRVLLKNAAIYNVQFYKDNTLFTDISHILILPKTSDTNQFLIQLQKGVLQGSYSANDLTNGDWRIEAIANTIDTNYLWNTSNSHVSFYLLAYGDRNSPNKDSYFNLTNVTGSVYQFPLSADIELFHNAEKTIVKSMNINIGKTFIKVAGEAGERWNLHWTIDMPNLKNIYKEFSGSVSSQGTIISNEKTPFINANFNINNFGFKNIILQSVQGKINSLSSTKMNTSLLAKNIKYLNYVIPDIVLHSNVTLKSQTIDIISNAVSKENSLVANLQIPNFINNKVNKMTLSGNVKLLFPHIEQLLHTSYIKSPQGILEANLKIDGPINDLVYTANANIKNGQFHIPELGITPRNIQIHATVANSKILNFSANVTSGQGKVELKGNVDLNKNNFPLEMNIKGNQLEVVHTKEYQITASPDFKVNFAGENTSITGKLTLPFIHIILEQYNQAVELPMEVEFVNQKTKIQYFKNLLIKLELQLGNEAFLAYQNLSAHLRGRIFVYQIPGGLPTGQGAFIITDGSYRIYNKSFRINNGRLIYLGNLLKDPGLNIRAIQEASFSQTNFMGFHMASENDRMQLGVSITGTLEHPKVEFISNPLMSQDDILSYILFGQPRSNISGADALSLLGSVATSLNAEGNSTGEDNSENGFSGIFKMGFMNPIQALNFSLPISRHWYLQTETSLNEVGADILYNYDSTIDSNNDNAH